MNIDKTIEEFEEQCKYNIHDFGEMGEFVRVRYAKNFLRDVLQKQRDEIYKDISEDLVAMANEYSIMEKCNSPYVPYSKVIRLINKLKL